MSRRGAALWSEQAAPAPATVDVLVPTVDRVTELAVTLAGLAGQDGCDFRVVISDQSERPAFETSEAVQSMLRVLRAQGRAVETHHHLPRRGVAEQRQFLLEQSHAPFVLFLDDDVWLEPGTLERMHRALVRLDCGFVGSAVQGLSYLEDVRPHQQEPFEPWEGPVIPERVRPDSPGFARWMLHNAANPTHLAGLARERGLLDDDHDWLAYRIAWVGGCVLYRRDALLACGGFDFWDRLPPGSAGEDVAAQWRVMETYGGAGLLPSGAVHLEAETTVPVRDVNAIDVLFTPETAPESDGAGAHSHKER